MFRCKAPDGSQFDKLTVTAHHDTYCHPELACRRVSLPKEEAHRSMQTLSPPFEFLRINSSGDGRILSLPKGNSLTSKRRES